MRFVLRRWGVLPAVLATFAAVFYAIIRTQFWLGGQLLVGMPALRHVPKVQDVLAPLGACLAAALVGRGLQLPRAGRGPQPALAHGHTDAQILQQRPWRQVLWLTQVPLVCSLAGTLLMRPLPWLVALMSPLGAAIVWAVRPAGGADAQMARQAGWIAFYAQLAAFAPPAVVLAVCRLWPAWASARHVHFAPVWLATCLLLTSFLVAAGARASLRRGRTPLRWLAPLAQACLPLGYLALWPAEFALPDGSLYRYATTAKLPLALAALLAAAWLQLLWRSTQAARQTGPGGQAPAAAVYFAPLATFGIWPLVFLSTQAAPTISADDYHFGEKLLGLAFYGRDWLPYLNHLPAHGLLEDDLAGLVAKLFFDGTTGVLVASSAWVQAGAALLAFVSVWSTHQNALWAFGLVFLLAPYATALVCAAVFVWWSHLALHGRAAAFFGHWGLMGCALILLTPAQGLGMMLAFLPWLTLRLLAAAKAHGRGLWRTRAPFVAALAVFGIGCVACVTPVGRMLFAATAYVRQNGAVNLEAYGLPWSMSYATKGAQPVVLDLVRMSWVGFCLLVAARWPAVRHWRAWLAPKQLLCLTSLLFVGTLVPYAMGRIDPMHLSRAGYLSAVAWALCWPAVTWARPGGAPHTPQILAGFALSALVTNPFSAPNFSPQGTWRLPQPLLSLAPLQAVRPRLAAGPLLRAAEHGLANTGTAAISPDHLAQLTKLGRVLQAALLPHETFFDCNNRNAYYAYLGRRPPVPTAAYYNAAAPALQRRNVRLLQRQPPPLALLEAADIVHDSVKMALRTPALYHWVLDTYAPYEEDGFILGRRRVHPGQQTSAAERALLQRALAQHELHQLPISWGERFGSLRRSWQMRLRLLPDTQAGRQGADTAPPFALEDLERTHQGLRVTGPHPAVTFSLADHPLPGAAAAMWSFSLACEDPTARPRLVARFFGDDAQAADPEVDFLAWTGAGKGVQVVPLDAAPSWRTLGRVKNLRLELDPGAGCANFVLAEPTLWTVPAYLPGGAGL